MLSSSWDGRPFGHNRHWLKIGGCAPFGGLGPHQAQCGLGWGLPPYQVASWSIQPFGHNRHGLKMGGSAPFCGEGELGFHLTQCHLGRGLPPYQLASWFIQPFCDNRYGPKLGGGLCPFRGREMGPPLTQCGPVEAYQHAKFHLDPSNRLATIHQRYRQTGQDNGPISQGDPFYKWLPKK